MLYTDSMNDLTPLRELGLRDTEINTYFALLKNGPTSIRGLASSTGINRGTTYEALKSLSETGLVAYVRKGERHKYRAESPERIYDLIADRRRTLLQVESEAKKFVPSLMALGERRLGEPAVRFYEDDEGIVVILRDVLNTAATLHPKQYYAYSSRALRKYLYRRFPNFTRRRIAENIFVKVIAAGAGGEVDELSERRWIADPGEQQLASYTLIYGTKIAIISVAPDETPYGVVIEDPGAAAMQKLLFETLWSRLEKSPHHG
jgi:sugar-specific transcriptional regulator TrmB